MKVNHVEMVISAVKPDQYPEDGLPEFALAGTLKCWKIFIYQ